MAYIFENILGTFYFDDKFKPTSKKGTQPLPKDKIPDILQEFKDRKYYQEFYEKNLQLTKEAIKNSVNEDNLIIQTISSINELDRIINSLAKRLREWYSLYLPEFSESLESHEKFVEIIITKTKAQLLKELKIKTGMGADLKKEDVGAEVKAKAAEVFAKEVVGKPENIKECQPY